MSLKYNLFLHLLISVVFTLVFIYGSLYFNDYIVYVNQEKSLFPILIYTNTLSEANDVLDFVSSHEVYSLFNLTYPDSLANLLIDKYGLTDFRRAVRDFTLPFLLEIFINPFEAEKLSSFIYEITSFFPNNIIHYNENIWLEIDLQTARLTKILFTLQIIALALYLSFQLFFRMIIIFKNKESISAIKNSGMTQSKVALKRIQETVTYLFFSTILMIIIAFFLNFFMIYRDFSLSINNLNLNLLIMLFVVNALFVLFQKPIYTRYSM